MKRRCTCHPCRAAGHVRRVTVAARIAANDLRVSCAGYPGTIALAPSLGRAIGWDGLASWDWWGDGDWDDYDFADVPLPPTAPASIATLADVFRKAA